MGSQEASLANRRMGTAHIHHLAAAAEFKPREMLFLPGETCLFFN